MTVRQLIIGVVAALLTFVLACGDDAPVTPSSIETERVTATPVPTPLENVECGADLPDVTLVSAGGSQPALPLASEWVGLDCVIGGPGADYYYITAEPLEVSTLEIPTLVLSLEPRSLSVLVWSPDLTNSTIIASGEIAIPMDSTNVARRFNPTELDVRPLAEQRLEIADIPPGDYAFEVMGGWADGVATLSLHVAVTE